MLTALNEIVQYAYQTPHSSWYREICSEQGIQSCPVLTSLDEFQMLPLVDRATLNRFSPFARLSSEPSLVDDIRSTSGTSGQAPLVYLRTTRYKQIAERLVRDGARRRLYLWGYQHVITHIESDHRVGLQTVICDPNQLTNHLPLVSKLSIDTLGGTPSLLLLFGQYLEPVEARLQIRYLELCGEPCRPSILAGLKQLFPLARFYDHYAMGEIGEEIGIRTPDCPQDRLRYFHLNSNDLFAENVGGELVLTHLNPPMAFPLIRYKTGDQLCWFGADTCQCGHQGVSFELAGRANVDFVRIAGVEIRYDELSQVLSAFDDRFEPFLSAEVSERVSSGTQKVRLTVRVVRSPSSEENATVLSQKLQEALVETLRLSATTYLKDMIQIGLFDLPEVVCLEEIPVSTKSPGIRLVED